MVGPLKKPRYFVEGWRNSYTLVKAGDQTVVDFDLRQTPTALTGRDNSAFRMTSMNIGHLPFPKLRSLFEEATRETRFTRSAWKYRVREAEIALAALEKRMGRECIAHRIDLERMKESPPKDFDPEPPGFRLALGRLIIAMFPIMLDGLIYNRWKAGQPPRLASSPLNAAAEKALASMGLFAAPQNKDGPQPRAARSTTP